MSKSYFLEVYRRENKVKKALLEFFFLISSYPRLLIEVFTRSRFGERYLTASSVIMCSFLLFYVPFFLSGNFDFMHPRRVRYGEMSFLAKYGTWLIFTLLFLLAGIWHLFETKENGSTMENKRFSLSDGAPHPFIRNFKIPFLNDHVKDLLIEPVPFFILGFVLWKLDQNLGMLLMICSVIYLLSYIQAYKVGNNFVLDKIDQIIFNEELESTFVGNGSPENSRGVNFYTNKPTDEEMRKKVAIAMSMDSETALVL